MIQSPINDENCINIDAPGKDDVMNDNSSALFLLLKHISKGNNRNTHTVRSSNDYDSDYSVLIQERLEDESNNNVVLKLALLIRTL